MSSPYPNQHVMIDLETLGTGARSIILTIGAIKFDPFGDHSTAKQGGQLVGVDWFYRRICMDSCKAIGMTADAGTIDWWMQQAADVRAEAFAPDQREPITKVIDDFTTWFGSAQFPWSHGKDFDITMLNEVYRTLNRQVPWQFWNTYDTRTAYKLTGVEKLPKGHKHHALWDCWRQIVGVQWAYRKLGSGGNQPLGPTLPPA